MKLELGKWYENRGKTAVLQITDFDPEDVYPYSSGDYMSFLNDGSFDGASMALRPCPEDLVKEVSSPTYFELKGEKPQ